MSDGSRGCFIASAFAKSKKNRLVTAQECEHAEQQRVRIEAHSAQHYKDRFRTSVPRLISDDQACGAGAAIRRGVAG
jgi:hypothetical protein